MSIIICLDAGHSSIISGAYGNGLREEEIVLKLVKKIGEKLSKNGIIVFYTRKDGNLMSGCTTGSQDLNARCTYANNNNVDYFISIHNNSATSTQANGHETLYNKRFSNSKELAMNIQTELITATGMTDRGLKERNDLRVLNGTDMPSCLVEVGFLSNINDANKLKDDSFLDTVAISIAKGICKTISIPYKENKVKDEALEKAIDLLSTKNIKIQKESWNSTEVINLSNVPLLIEKLGGLDNLVKIGVIKNVEMWKNKTYMPIHVRALIIKSSTLIQETLSKNTNVNVTNCIETISKYAVKNYDNSKVLPSLVIAQACWESGYLSSELATKANNPFGMKYNNNFSDKPYRYKNGEWCTFKSLEDAVIQQGKFYNASSRYSGIVGEKDIKKVLSSLEKSGYCEGTGYSNNINKMIVQYNLVEYDDIILKDNVNKYEVINVSKDVAYQNAIKRFFDKGIVTQESWKNSLSTQHTEALVKKTGIHLYNAKTYDETVKIMKEKKLLTSDIWNDIKTVKTTHLRSFIIKISNII